MRILEITNGKTHAREVFKEATEVTLLPLPDLLSADLLGPYDIVYCPHTLQCAERTEVPKVVERIAAVLKPYGEVWVITPSLEWAATQVLSNSPNPLAQAVLFGEVEHHRSGFTLLWLRALIEGAGLITRKAYQGTYQVLVDGEPVNIPQNVVIAMKVEQPAENPAEAI